ncbi:hypothetical protein GCM10027275_10670 [Rhabdobacter roseus]|uniref:Lanthionine synthetase C-like protein n=1 Tax=Rhabdobacter roseus TaxID=1655419 RepID=A0A840TFQ8_9BACT|nr:hypothetical protein [Rhabdobacter roseus]MBB5282976.1 hypothetical protein [Rhabdobacter roseus]
MGISSVFDPVPLGQIEGVCRRMQAQRHREPSFGLDYGCLGQAVFYYLYARHTDQEAFLRESADQFDRACACVNTDRSFVIPRDFCDLGAVVHYLAEGGALAVEPGYFLGDVDAFLHQGLEQALRRGAVSGFTTGAAGYGLYFLHRARYDPARFAPTLERLADWLAVFTLKTPLGCCWPSTRHQTVTGVDLTLAYGQASVVLLLAAMVELGFADPRKVRSVVAGAIALIDHCLKVTQSHTVRVSLPEGHLGTAYALLRAGLVFDTPAWKALGESLLRHCAHSCQDSRRKLPRAGIRGGVAGATLAFARIHRLTDNALYGEAARQCQRILLRQTKQDEDGNTPSPGEVSDGKALSGVGATLIRSSGQLDFDRLIWLI